ncbi:ESX-1 secretion-associated protein [Mycobacterium sp. 4D054]|uniref:ESX-1 secretion-associated protein n=1 Tax=unclassified Mycobacterium TaxID=2642494 RepID=UPI0021B49A0B|nr:ESX-1 secretion-associated protein [Mycobacterium sp. SMC-8]UXA13718.1 ESX-1 secretion-associated protein [Mycobacterium sp. SMC-8]
MTAPLEVDTSVLRRVGGDFSAAGDRMAGMRADAPLADAAAGVPELQTAAACYAAQSTIAAEMETIAGNARTYGTDLKSAADRYDATDEASGEAIEGVGIPAPR